MNPEQQRIELAKIDGWEHSKTLREWFKRLPDGGVAMEFPNYLNDLNAVHELEKKLQHGNGVYEHTTYRGLLSVIVGQNGKVWHATAAQRCEAILRVKGIWK